jgi:hypothetical protein
MRTMLQQPLGWLGLRMVMLAALVFAVGTAQAQTAPTTFGFESGELGDWKAHVEAGQQYNTTAAVTTDRAYSGTYSVIVAVVNDQSRGALVNETFQLSAGDTIRYRVYLPADQVAAINGLQPFLLHSGWQWNDRWYSAANDLTADAWNTLEYVVPAGITATNRFGIQITGYDAAGTGTIYVDHITINEEPTAFITKWGFETGNTGDWDFASSEPGSVWIGSEAGYPAVNWAALRGVFDEITPEVGETVVVSGTLELIGGGLAQDGFNGSSSLRWGIFHRGGQDTLAVSNDTWTAGSFNSTSGYLFTPPSGVVDNLVEWQGTRPPGGGDGSGDRGSVGVIMNRQWNSTNGANDYVIDDQVQLPTYAAAEAGVYDFAFSFTRTDDDEVEVRYMLVNQDESYYFVGSTLDDGTFAEGGVSFNTFGLALGLSASATGLSLSGVTAELGEPIELPETPLPTVPMRPVAEWAFESGADASGDWEVEITAPGSVTIGSEGEYPPANWAALRGRFSTITLNPTQSVVVHGTMELVGGGLAVDGFNGSSSLRHGIYYRAGADTLAITDNFWPAGTGGGHQGYLFMPPSGADIQGHPTWGNVVEGSESWGSVGYVGGGTWYSTHAGNSYVLSQQLQRPPYAVAPEGTYDFAQSITRNEDGTTEVRFYFVHEDGSYYWAGSETDEWAWPADTLGGAYRAPSQFNTVGFAFGLNSEAHRVNFTDVMVGTANEPIPLPIFELPTPPEGPHEVGDLLLVNGNFDLSAVGPAGGNAPYWTFNLTAGGAQGEADIVQDSERGRVLRMTMNEWNEDITSDWHVEAVNEPFYPQEGDFIQGSVWLRADEDGRMANVYYGLPESGSWNRFPTGMGGTGGGGILFTLSDQWELYTLPAHTVTARDEENTMRFGISLNHEENDGGVIYISNARVKVEATEVSNEADEVAHSFALEQNYPNPFNPVTTIRYEVGSAGHVTLTVYNALGQRVATLVDGVQTTGRHQVQFNANTLPSGVYFYQMRAEGHVHTKRMVLLK